MRLFRIPSVVQSYFHQYVWRIQEKTPSIYLTFDDGPNPLASTYVLEVLKEQNIKATFFCVGDNIRKFPSIIELIKTSHHTFGNHTQNHLKGWNTSTESYLDNVVKCDQSLENMGISTKIFRPPYGRITKQQGKILHAANYKIIMWDILTYDYDKNISIEPCLAKIIDKSRNGSIVVFHDSEKALPQLKQLLEPYIIAMKAKGFQFKVIV